MRLPTDVAEQTALADLVTTARAEIDSLRKQADMLQLQKRGLMQRLLTGEWRIPKLDDESSCEPAHASVEAAQ
jgi:type I restriction enzyme S subunit